MPIVYFILDFLTRAKSRLLAFALVGLSLHTANVKTLSGYVHFPR